MKKAIILALSLLCFSFGTVSAQTLKGDVNGDGLVNTSDVTALLDLILNPTSPEYVDLGLPGGVLWATCNVGASKAEDYGLYFAWGETTGYYSVGRNFGWATYKWCKGEDETLTKYCTQTSYGTVDNKSTLEAADDAATYYWGDSWRMPTKQECDDLVNSNYTTTEWTTLNGVYGRKITSKSNGNSIFLPAGGRMEGAELSDRSSYGFYWSNTLCTERGNCYAGSLYFRSGGIYTSYSYRYLAHNIRPVRK